MWARKIVANEGIFLTKPISHVKLIEIKDNIIKNSKIKRGKQPKSRKADGASCGGGSPPSVSIEKWIKGDFEKGEAR